MKRQWRNLLHGNIARGTCALAFALALTGASGCGHEIEPGEKPLPRENVAAARLETVAETPLAGVHEASGTVRAASVFVISPRIMAVIEEIAVNEGDMVRQGQTLVRLRSAEMDARYGQARAGAEAARAGLRAAEEGLEEARAGMALAESTFARYAKLHEARAVSDQEFDGVSTQATLARKTVARVEAGVEVARGAVAQAEAGLREAEIYREFTVLKAPGAGRVQARMAEPGTMAAPGMPILRIGGGGFRMEAPLEERLLKRVAMGDGLALEIPALGLAGTGTVSGIVPAVESASRTFTVKVELPAAWEAKVTDGLYGTVGIALPEAMGMTVPSGAIVRRGQISGVYVVDGEDVVRFRFVRTGRDKDGRTEILSGLETGERIVAEDTLRMKDGARMVSGPQGS